jgi:phosphoenolpyruvate phosphomutase
VVDVVSLAKVDQPPIFGPEGLWIGVYDALSTRLVVQHASSRADHRIRGLWVSGLCVSAALRARPDASLVSTAELLTVARNVCLAAGRIPVVLDCDCGWGDASVLSHVLDELCRTTTVSAIAIEDKTFPKRNSFYPDAKQELDDIDHFVQKLRVAARIRDKYRPDLRVIARTEALIAGKDVFEAVTRGLRFADAGADALMVQARGPLADLQYVGAELRSLLPDKPLVTAPSAFEEARPATFWSHGWAIVIYANQLLRRQLRTGKECIESLGDGRQPFGVQAAEGMSLDELRVLVEADRSARSTTASLDPCSYELVPK